VGAAVEDEMLPDLVGESDRIVGDAGPGEQAELVVVKTREEGLCGLLKTTSRVFGVKAAASASAVIRQSGGASRMKRGIPPARSTKGR
jgi:hypothetical protein